MAIEITFAGPVVTIPDRNKFNIEAPFDARDLAIQVQCVRIRNKMPIRALETFKTTITHRSLRTHWVPQLSNFLNPGDSGTWSMVLDLGFGGRLEYYGRANYIISQEKDGQHVIIPATPEELLEEMKKADQALRNMYPNIQFNP